MENKNIIKIGNTKIDLKSIKEDLIFYRIEHCSKCCADRIFAITRRGLSRKSITGQRIECKKHKWNYVYQYIDPKFTKRFVYFGRTVVELLCNATHGKFFDLGDEDGKEWVSDTDENYRKLLKLHPEVLNEDIWGNKILK